MERIEVAVDPALDAAFPGQRAARIVIETRDGRRLEHLQPNRKGDPEQALTDEELEGKYLELASPVIGAERSRALLAQLWALDKSATLPRA
jgi:2-methylcitrate dehydratase PrpD